MNIEVHSNAIKDIFIMALKDKLGSILSQFKKMGAWQKSKSVKKKIMPNFYSVENK